MRPLAMAAPSDDSRRLLRADVVPLIGVGRGAGGLERAVDPVVGLADHLHAVDRIGGGGRVELHGVLSPRFREDGGQRALDQRQLEGVVFGRRPRPGQQPAPPPPRRAAIARRPPRLRQGFGADAAEGDAAGAVGLDDRRDRDQREGIGRAVAHLAIDVLARRAASAG